MLKSLQITNFRGFRDHAIDFTPFCLLIGQNNAGKTTIIEALRLIATAIKRSGTARFAMAPRWLERTLPGPMYRFSVDTIGIDQKSIHYNYNSDEPAIIRARFSNHSQVIVAVGEDSSDFFCQLVYAGGKKVNMRGLVNPRRFPAVNVMPPVGSLLSRETRREPAYMQKHIDGYLSHRHIRNQMAAAPELFESFKERLSETWDHLLLGEVEYGLGERQDELGITVRDGPFVSEMGLVGSGLQAWIQTIWFLSRLDPASTVVLDEPDIYLHADLQRKLVRLLADGSFRQTIIATHSLEMIASVAPSEIISVTKRSPRSRPLTSHNETQGVAEKLGTVHNIQLSKLAETGVVLFVEGKDHSFLDQFAFKRGNFEYDRFSCVPHFAIGGMNNWRRAATAAQAFSVTSGGRIKSILVIDRDYKSESELSEIREEASKTDLDVYWWEKKELENYLLCPRTIASFISSRREDVVQRSEIETRLFTILSALDDNLAAHIADSIQSANRRLSIVQSMVEAKAILSDRRAKGDTVTDIVSGKVALSRLSEVCKRDFGVSFSPMTICRAMRSSDVPREMSYVIEGLIEPRPWRFGNGGHANGASTAPSAPHSCQSAARAFRAS